jgi:hypothetical protein
MNTAVLDTLVKMANLKPRQTSVSPILAQRQEQLAKVIVKWEKLPNIFAENFFDDYPIDLLKKQSTILFGEMGKLLKINTMIPENQLRGYCIIECEKGNLKLAFTLSPENPALIQEYHLTKE